MFSQVESIIRQLADMPDADIASFCEIGKLKRFGPKSCFIRAGQIPAEFGVVLNGLLRYGYNTEKGKEFTKAFMPEGSFVSSYSAMISESPSHFFIQTIEESEIFVVPYAAWQRLRAENIRWNLLLVKLLEKGYSTKEKREREFLLCDAETRYRIFREEYPDLENRIKQNMIASYLGITPIALSRIRHKTAN